MPADTDVADGPITSERLDAHLATRWLGRRAQLLDVCDSTNDVVSQAARQGAPSGLLVVAETQRRGRGRQGRAWMAAPGENLTFSLLARLGRPIHELPRVTLAAGVALAEALAGLGIEAALKWPNDVLVPTGGGWRKLAGILTEMATGGQGTAFVVIGIGLNVNTAVFPAAIAQRATSLRALAGRDEVWDRARVLGALLGALEPVLETFEREGLGALRGRWESLMARDTPYRAETDAGQVVEGWQQGLAEDGALLLRDEDGRLHRVLSGELEVAGFSPEG